ncbi:hypothetical protein Poli38472_010377 [Pythium oligandrum]|uniref:Uncharacterized protein n=1 Tax=Pythium oligandrum TaxID=41045 RepID=A0A8K1C2Y1_PYTOL|nr:hypothetical protein Poli38472_010377 [Pythium oligandrum]|eukprot:TMW55495.1 hypothetical protein Poli38472_010377 [Pythium oligandrum]
MGTPDTKQVKRRVKRLSQADNTWRWIYQIDVSKPLAFVDLSHSVISLVLSPEANERYLHWMKRHYGRLANLLRVVMVLMYCSWFMPPHIGLIVAIPLFVTGFPPVLAASSLLNRELIRQLCFQFEFWYATCLNALTWSLFAVVLGDLRALSCSILFAFTQLVISLDANFRTMTTSIRTTFLWIPSTVCVSTYCAMEALRIQPSDGPMRWRVFNLLVNVCLTLAILIMNKTYKRRRLYYKDFAYTKIVPCAIYRSRIVLSRWTQPKGRMKVMKRGQSQEPLAIVTFDSLHRAVVRHLSTDLNQQIRLVPFKRSLFDSRRTIIPKYSPITTLSVWLCLVIYGMCFLGLAHACMSVVFLIRSNGDLSRRDVADSSINSLIFTTLFCIPFVCSYQKHLVQKLLRNFDYWFSSLQFAVGSVLLSDLCQWTLWCVSIISWNLWFQWVLMMDALTPIVKKRLRFRKCYAVPVTAAILVNAIGTLYLTSAPGTTIFHSTEDSTS